MLAARSERGIDAVRRHGDLAGSDSVQLDRVPLRALGHGDHVVGASRRARYDRLEREAVEQCHRGRVTLEVEVVEGDDGAPPPAEWKCVLEVREAGAQRAQEARQRPGHSRLLQAGRQLDRVDARRHSRGVARDGGETEVGRDTRQLAQEVLDVRLLAGPVPAEYVRVDHDEIARSGHRTSSS